MSAIVTAAFVIFAIVAAVAIVGAIVSCLRRPLQQMDDDPHLTAYGEQPHAPWAALRSGAERLSNTRGWDA